MELNVRHAIYVYARDIFIYGLHGMCQPHQQKGMWI